MVYIFDYIKFYFKSTSNHNIHSPLVYDLISFCFFDGMWKRKKKNFLFKKNNKSNSIFFLNRLKEHLKYNLKDELFFTIKSDYDQILLIDELNVKYIEFVLMIDNCQNMRPLVNKIKNKKTYVIIDFYFWVLVLKKTRNTPQYYRIRVF